MSHFIDSFHQIYPIRRGRMNDASQIYISPGGFLTPALIRTSFAPVRASTANSITFKPS